MVMQFLVWMIYVLFNHLVQEMTFILHQFISINTRWIDISRDSGQQLDLLILDNLYKKGYHNVHMCFPQTLEAIKRLCPKRALLIGMTGDFDHHEDNVFLMEWSKREGIPVQLAYDGLRLPIEL